MNAIAENFAAIYKRIHKAERSSGREEGATQLVAVTKNQEQPILKAAIDAGHRVFGENKVQEAMRHWAEFRNAVPDLRLHLIGPLQSNKVSDAVALFDVIETLDREKLVPLLAAEMKKQGRQLDIYVQVNTGEEDQKAGVVPHALGAFLAFCKAEGLAISGLMCIPPSNQPAALHFALLKKLAQVYDLANLSMGMSADFEKGIALGATHVRIGTALFGARG